MSVILDAVIQTCYERATKNRALENRVSSIILKVKQNAGTEKEDDSRQSLENHVKVDEIRRCSNRKFDSGHDVHRVMTHAEYQSKPFKRREYHYVSRVMWVSFNLFLSREAGLAYLNFGITELLKFWTEKIIEIDSLERNKPSLGLLLENDFEIIRVPCSGQRVELRYI